MADPLEGPVWPTDDVTIAFATSGGPFSSYITNAQYQAVFLQCEQDIEAVCGVKFETVAATDNPDITLGFGNLLPTAIGLTSYTYATGTGNYFAPGTTVQIEDPNINPVSLVSGDYFWNGWATDWNQVITHELGHALGLAHNTVDPNSIMAPSAGPANRVLDQSDIDALQELYGPKSAPATPPSNVAQVTDVTISATGNVQGAAYSGPVAELTEQYIVPAAQISDWLNVTPTGTASWFIHTGSGNDAIDLTKSAGSRMVVDGGTGSNFIVDNASQYDTGFVDMRGTTTDVWSTIAGAVSGDDATVWGITPAMLITWNDNEGAAGYTGVTMHATAAGKPEASLTLSGYTSADVASGRISYTFATDAASGSAFMNLTVHS